MQIYIHIGPPKSGTSAIQNWCARHQQTLLENSVYYPSHTVDENGISSGNLRSLFSKDSSGNLEFKQTKLLKEIKHAKGIGAKIIVFSSEFFFKQAELLIDAIPDAKFIAYIRFGLEQFESSYNQGVKRHGRTAELSIPDHPRSQTLIKLQKISERCGNNSRMILRGYGDPVFSGGNIITDFLSSFEEVDLRHIEIRKEKRINSSYSHEGLQLKRWFNQFDLGILQRSLDTFLQMQGQGAESYSLMDTEKFDSAKASYLSQLSAFCKNYSVNNAEKLLNQCALKKIGKVRLQHISLEVFSRLISSFIKKDKRNLSYLNEFLSQNTPNTRSDYLRFKAIEAVVSRNTSISDLAFLKSFKAHTVKRFKGSFKEMALGKSSSFSEIVPKNTEVKLFDIPFSSDFFWLKAAQESKRGFWQLYYNQLNGRELTEAERAQNYGFSGNQIGHFSPNAFEDDSKDSCERILFLQRPIERFWSHLNYVLDTESPKPIFNDLIAICEQHKVASLLSLAKTILTKYEHHYLCTVYSKFLKDANASSITTLIVKNGSEINVKKGIENIIDISNGKFEKLDIPHALYELENLLEEENEIFGKFTK